jgi:hypothetical protein
LERRRIREKISVSTAVYVALMLGIIIVCCMLTIPVLLLKKCPSCGARNGLDAKTCKRCKTPFPEEPPA